MEINRIDKYVERHKELLNMLVAMWTDPLVQCYNDDPKPNIQDELERCSVFLAGPTSRNQLIEYNWRSQAVAYLREARFSGYIYVPESRGQEEFGDFIERSYIHSWESTRLLNVTYPVFWIPRNSDELIGLNTNLEYGIFIGKILSKVTNRPLVGWPPGAERMGLLNHYGIELAGCRRFSALKDLCYAVASLSNHISIDND